MSALKCRHIMPNGSRCEAYALRAKPYCYFHTRLHRYAAAPSPGPMDTIKLPVLEDRSAIQLSLAQILDALGSGTLDPSGAGLFLYALQIATQNVERNQFSIPFSTVESMTVNANGDELAPEPSGCTQSDDCYTCPDRDVCVDCVPFEDVERDADLDDSEAPVPMQLEAECPIHLSAPEILPALQATGTE